MEHVRAHGYPVPAVHEVGENRTDLVMERIYGPSMGAYLNVRPWRLRQQGRVLAGLHHQLHEIPPPPYLPPSGVGEGEHFLHLDLHPLNVIIGNRGPVVIDWSNAARGNPEDDVALALVLMTSGQLPHNAFERKLHEIGRSLLIGSFMGQFDRERVGQRLRRVVEWKVKDPHMSTTEVRGMWRLVASAEASK
jgi:tRNA A-37 threonylcarbamoyl transferase component Bud32